MTDAAALNERVRQFVAARSVSDDRPAYACRPGESAELFGLLDAIYSLYVVKGLQSPEHAGQLGEAVAAWQGEDGWFRSGDAQGHHRLHVTAYALGALALASSESGTDGFRRLVPIQGFVDETEAALHGPDALSLLDRIHFWRGSHKSGGIAAIVGQCHQAGWAGDLLGIDDADAWLAAWAERWDRAADADGLWRFGSPLRELFYIPYALRRHREPYAVIGGAAHIYWIHRRLDRVINAPAALTDYILQRAGDRAICEDSPYCLDFDRLCLLEYALPHLGDTARARAARELVRQSTEAIRTWFDSQPPAAWFASSHRLPGALAAIAVGERVLGAEAKPQGDAPLRDLLATAWWL